VTQRHPPVVLLRQHLALATVEANGACTNNNSSNSSSSSSNSNIKGDVWSAAQEPATLT